LRALGEVWAKARTLADEQWIGLRRQLADHQAEVVALKGQKPKWNSVSNWPGRRPDRGLL
jgi:hypothetical protein